MFGCDCHEEIKNLQKRLDIHAVTICDLEKKIKEIECNTVILSENWSIWPMKPLTISVSDELSRLRKQFNQLISFLNLNFEHQSEKTVLKKLDKNK